MRRRPSRGADRGRGRSGQVEPRGLGARVARRERADAHTRRPFSEPHTRAGRRLAPGHPAPRGPADGLAHGRRAGARSRSFRRPTPGRTRWTSCSPCRTPRVQASESPHRTRAARLVRDLAAEQPFLLWADDAQWSPEGKVLRLVHRLARGGGLTRRSRLLMIVTLRPSSRTTVRAARRALLALPRVDHLELGPVGPARPRARARRHSRSLPDGVATAACLQAAGNPLIALEAVRSFLEDSGLHTVPTDPNAVLQARIDGVTKGEGGGAFRSALARATLLGRSFTVGPLARLCAVPGDPEAPDLPSRSRGARGPAREGRERRSGRGAGCRALAVQPRPRPRAAPPGLSAAPQLARTQRDGRRAQARQGRAGPHRHRARGRRAALRRGGHDEPGACASAARACGGCTPRVSWATRPRSRGACWSGTTSVTCSRRRRAASCVSWPASPPNTPASRTRPSPTRSRPSASRSETICSHSPPAPRAGSVCCECAPTARTRPRSG
jgi:hypothetical protein